MKPPRFQDGTGKDDYVFLTLCNEIFETMGLDNPRGSFLVNLKKLLEIGEHMYKS